MLVASSFDLWKKDVFFPAAEEVQESTDIMESTYRAWARERRERQATEDFDEICRELQTALGTAKWQLEEFEEAVRSSYGQHCDDHSTARHRQFISAIANQISHVETALKESFSVEGKKPLRWVQLDDEECDDFAAFLSGTSQSIQSAKKDYAELGPSVKRPEEKNTRRKDVDLKSNVACKRDIYTEIKGVENAVDIPMDPSFVVELKGKEIPGMGDNIIYDADRATNTRKKGSSPRKKGSSPNCGDLRIVIADEAEQSKRIIPGFEDTPKEKGSKHVFWKQRCGPLHNAMGAVCLLNQIFSRVGTSHKQSQSPQKQRQTPLRLQNRCSVKVTLGLMLTVFLLVPFVFYSS